MQVVGVLLTLLSITLIVAPVGAVVIMYQNNLSELVIPPQISSLILGDEGVSSSFFVNDTGPTDLSSLISPQFVSADIDEDANTFTVVVDVTNNVNYTFTLNNLGADVYSTRDNYHLVSVQLSNPPVTLTPGGTSRVVIVGSWTDAAETYFVNNYRGASSISVQLENLTIDVNGIAVTMSEPFTIDVPLTLEG
jgi:hypothetical protein